MSEGYRGIIKEHLAAAWARGEEVLKRALPAEVSERALVFRAFGRECLLTREGIILGKKQATGPEGVLIALYARNVKDRPVRLEPLVSFRELPGSMPYQAAFASRSEMALVPHVAAIHEDIKEVLRRFSGHMNEDAASGDFSFTLYPLPRVPLCYIFFHADDEFPASVTCLFPRDGAANLPLDALADVGEYTARGIISIASRAK